MVVYLCCFPADCPRLQCSILAWHVMHFVAHAQHVCTPSRLPVLWAGAHQGLSLLVMLCMLSMLSCRLSSSSGRCLLGRQGSAVSRQLCRQVQGSLLSMGALGKGPEPLRRSLAGVAALIGGVLNRLSGLSAVALQHVCHGGGESSLSAMPAQFLQMCSLSSMPMKLALMSLLLPQIQPHLI